MQSANEERKDKRIKDIRRNWNKTKLKTAVVNTENPIKLKAIQTTDRIITGHYKNIAHLTS